MPMPVTSSYPCPYPACFDQFPASVPLLRGTLSIPRTQALPYMLGKLAFRMSVGQLWKHLYRSALRLGPSALVTALTNLHLDFKASYLLLLMIVRGLAWSDWWKK